MEVKRICQWCGKPFIAQKTTTCYCSPQCSKRGYKHRIKERKMELRHIQEMQELRSSLEKQEYFTFSQAARLMGVSRQYIYKLVKEDKLRASRISGRMSLVRRADIELMLKSKPYERLVAKSDFDISEYYTAEEIAEKYKVNAKWVWTYTRQHKVPKVVQLLQQEAYRCRLCQIRGGFRPDRVVHTGRNPREVRNDTCRHPFTSVPE